MMVAYKLMRPYEIHVEKDGKWTMCCTGLAEIAPKFSKFFDASIYEENCEGALRLMYRYLDWLISL